MVQDHRSGTIESGWMGKAHSTSGLEGKGACWLFSFEFFFEIFFVLIQIVLVIEKT